MRLTPAQIRHFEIFGFLHLRCLLADEIAEIDAAFEAVWAAHGGGHHGRPHAPDKRSNIVPFADRHERLCRLLDDERVLGVCRDLLGEDFNYYASDGNLYVGDTGWHCDGVNRGIRWLKLAIYLDPLRRDHGALRVIPGSHRLGEPFADACFAASARWRELYGLADRDVPAVALETNPGDLVVFDNQIQHASIGGGARRRMFTLNFSQRYPENRLGELRQAIAALARFWTDRAHGERMVATAGPERMRHLEQVRANDGHLAELSAKARAAMPEPGRA